MQAVPFPARQERTRYRHELRTLTYVTLDEGNGGIVRNLNHEGVGVQAVGALRPRQRVRLRFELRHPRLRVDTAGDVTWSSASGQCGIRLVDLPEGIRRQIDEWIFANLLDSLSHEQAGGSMFGARVLGGTEEDGLILSGGARPVIRMPAPVNQQPRAGEQGSELDWLSRPVSAKTLARLVDALAVIAGLLMFAVIFLAIAHELPSWPLTAGIFAGVAVFVTGAYWFVFSRFGGVTLGKRLAQLSGAATGIKTEEDATRFR